MISRLILALCLVLPLSACGTKSELLKPDGSKTPHTEKDPSQPPTPLSR